MPTLSKAKKSVVKKASVTKRRRPGTRVYPGLVRDSVTGLLVNPLKSGQKPITRTALQAALAEAL